MPSGEIGLNKRNSNISTLDGQKVALSGKDFGQCDLYPTSLEYCPSGRFFPKITVEIGLFLPLGTENTSYILLLLGEIRLLASV